MKKIKSLKHKRELEVIKLSEELTELEKQKDRLESRLKNSIKSQKKYFNAWKKLDKWFIILITFSILIILNSIICIIFNVNKEIQINQIIALHFEKDLWNNLFFLGLSIFTISFIFFQLKKSVIHQMQINLFWKEWEELEDVSKKINMLKNEIIYLKADKYLASLPVFYLNGRSYIREEDLDPKNIHDPKLKSIFKKLKPYLKKIKPKTTRDLIKKGGVFSP